MSNKIILKAISAVIALGVGSTANSELPKPTLAHQMGHIDGMEKCYGIAKAGHNDCGTTDHNCAGESKIDKDKSAWILTPNGLCNKIVGGSLTPPEKV